LLPAGLCGHEPGRVGYECNEKDFDFLKDLAAAF
jgi:hypothetical protein